MNKDDIKGKAKQVEGSVQAAWGELTDTPSNVVKGNAKKLAGKAQDAAGDL